MERLGLILLFGLLNFGALGLGGLLMGEGPGSPWYQQLNKAPWTPPGWVFGAAWFTVMFCFSFYLAFLVQKTSMTFFWILIGLQVVFNVAWNYLFFNQHLIFPALIDLIFLTVLVWFLFFRFRETLGIQSLFLTPYMLWLLVAISLNAFAWLKN